MNFIIYFGVGSYSLQLTPEHIASPDARDMTSAEVTHIVWGEKYDEVSGSVASDDQFSVAP